MVNQKLAISIYQLFDKKLNFFHDFCGRNKPLKASRQKFCFVCCSCLFVCLFVCMLFPDGKKVIACEPQTYFRSSLLSLRKITFTEIDLPVGFAGVIFRRERSDNRKYVCVLKLLRSKKKEIKVIIVSGEKRRALFSPRIC